MKKAIAAEVLWLVLAVSLELMDLKFLSIGAYFIAWVAAMWAGGQIGLAAMRSQLLPALKDAQDALAKLEGKQS